MAAVDVSETLFHIEMVDPPTADMETIAARNTNARINPYSMAVAALVDRNSP